MVNESNQEPRGCGFDPWPHSVGQGSGLAMSCGVGHRRSSNPALLWLWAQAGSYSSDQTPSLGTYICRGSSPRKGKKKKKKRPQTQEGKPKIRNNSKYRRKSTLLKYKNQALIQPLAWKSPYASGSSLERAKRQKQTKEIHIATILLFFIFQGQCQTQYILIFYLFTYLFIFCLFAFSRDRNLMVPSQIR